MSPDEVDKFATEFASDPLRHDDLWIQKLKAENATFQKFQEWLIECNLSLAQLKNVQSYIDGVPNSVDLEDTCNSCVPIAVENGVMSYDLTSAKEHIVELKAHIEAEGRILEARTVALNEALEGNATKVAIADLESGLPLPW